MITLLESFVSKFRDGRQVPQENVLVIDFFVFQDDSYWWQARKEFERTTRAGLIPSRALQERRIIHDRTKKESSADAISKRFRRKAYFHQKAKEFIPNHHITSILLFVKLFNYSPIVPPSFIEINSIFIPSTISKRFMRIYLFNSTSITRFE